MRIVLFTGSLGTGGAERQFALLGRSLADRGCSVLFVTMESSECDPNYLAMLEGVRREVLFERVQAGPMRMVQLMNGWRKLLPHLQEFHPDVVYSCLEWPNWLASRSAGGMRTAPLFVAGVRNSAERMSWKRRLPVRLLARRGRIDAMIANSRAGLEEARSAGIRGGVETVVFNGIDTRHFTPVPEGARDWKRRNGIPLETKCIGHVGRLSPMKDHPSLLRAFGKLATRRRDVHLVCIGDGPIELRDRYEKMARDIGVHPQVHWRPHEEDMPSAYSACDVLVMSSRDGEGFPNAVAEAMACETPCVVTRVGEAAEIVGDGGSVVEVGDVDALALAMADLVGKPHLGRIARDRIQANYGITSMVDMTLGVFEKARADRGDAG
ncbi:MAG: glycosyltransferase [Planctomycetota bacterium]|nr:glycosyltransferase [Planctomycetota bacterium]